MDSRGKSVIFRIVTVFFATSMFGLGVGAVHSGHQSQCNTGTLRCCNQFFKPTSPDASQLLTKNGIGLGVLAEVKGMIAAGCTPVTAIGLGSSGQW
jgi:hypothetical protein